MPIWKSLFSRLDAVLALAILIAIALAALSAPIVFPTALGAW